MTWSIDLSGKTIIVTGGNRGIGYAISKQVAKGEFINDG
jgi:NAD(P)-dependent dehydrogenase (short-subunit alcohol dehydrogenase family)